MLQHNYTAREWFCYRRGWFEFLSIPLHTVRCWQVIFCGIQRLSNNKSRSSLLQNATHFDTLYCSMHSCHSYSISNMEEWVSKKPCHKEEKTWALSRFSSSLQVSSHESITRVTYKQQFENDRVQFQFASSNFLLIVQYVYSKTLFTQKNSSHLDAVSAADLFSRLNVVDERREFIPF